MRRCRRDRRSIALADGARRWHLSSRLSFCGLGLSSLATGKSALTTVLSTSPVPAGEKDQSIQDRLVGLELGRIMAVIGVVWIHSVASDVGRLATPAVRFSVPFFAACSVFLLFRSAAAKPSPPLLLATKKRFTRIYLPFLFWAAIYVGLTNAKSMTLGGPLKHVEPGGLLTGHTLHLRAIA